MHKFTWNFCYSPIPAVSSVESQEPAVMVGVDVSMHQHLSDAASRFSTLIYPRHRRHADMEFESPMLHDDLGLKPMELLNRRPNVAIYDIRTGRFPDSGKMSLSSRLQNIEVFKRHILLN